ncbi:MAG: glycosyltransferase family 2 protein, partial [Flavitalea sp.]
MNRPGIAAVVVWYKPEKSLGVNINSYLPDIEQLYIVDNSEEPDPEMHAMFSEHSKVQIITSRQNLGIAKALNIGITEASNAGYEWLLTMDQDSFFEKGVFEKYLDACFNYTGPAALFGLPYDPAFPKNAAADQLYVPVVSMITSGNLVNVSIARSIGGFDEKLFIDEVDHDFCYRAGIAGYEVICVRAGLLQHSLGESRIVSNTIGSGKKKTTLHNPVRLYYMVRNGLYIADKYAKTYPAQSRKRKKIIYVTLKNNLLHGSKQIASLRFATLGL